MAGALLTTFVLLELGLCAGGFEEFEPYVHWSESFLSSRRDCYARARHPLAATAERQLLEFYSRSEVPIWRGLLPERLVVPPELELPEAVDDSRAGAAQRRRP